MTLAFTTGVTPTEHEKAEWSRMATAAYAIGRNDVGHRYSAAAALPRGATIPTDRFDALQGPYRAWLCRDEWPAPLPGERGFQPGCGCCAGPAEDRCTCHLHQDIPRGLPARRCSIHCEEITT